MSFRKATSIFCRSLICLAILAIGGISFAQEEASLEELQKQWTELNAKLDAVEAELKSGEGDIEAQQTKFKDHIAEANELVNKIEETALSKLKTEPNNNAALRAILGILVNEAAKNNDAKVLKIGDQLIAQGINSEYFQIASKTDRLSTPAREIFDELLIRQEEAIARTNPRVKLTTTKGDILIELFEDQAPNTVANFISLVENGYYTDMIFHRVIENFMAQGGGFKMEGDKEVGGEGPGYSIACECFEPDTRQHFTGSLSMAHRGKDTGGGQFFLTFRRTDSLDGRHTCFGRVVGGMDILEQIERTNTTVPFSREEPPIPGVVKDKIVSATVVRKQDHDYVPKKIEESAPEKPATESTPEKSGEGESETNEDK